MKPRRDALAALQHCHAGPLIAAAAGSRGTRSLGQLTPHTQETSGPQSSVWGMREQPRTEQEFGVIDLHNANERPDSRFLILPRIIPALPGNHQARAETQRFPGLQQDQKPLGSACSLQHPHLEQSMAPRPGASHPWRCSLCPCRRSFKAFYPISRGFSEGWLRSTQVQRLLF